MNTAGRLAGVLAPGLALVVALALALALAPGSAPAQAAGSPVSSASAARIAPAAPTGSVAPPVAPPVAEGSRSGTRVGDILVVPVKGMINRITTEYLSRALKAARERQASLVLIEMDTPGGTMDSMWDIIKEILSSPVPVAVYVTPPGGHAASAGTFILLAAHVAAMAPATSIGAAHPVRLVPGGPTDKDKDKEKGKEKDRGRDKEKEKDKDKEKDKPADVDDDDDGSTMMRKVTNDAVTRMKQNAARHGRNTVWAEKAIRESATLGTDEAVREKVVDLMAESREKLLARIDGRPVVMSDGTRRPLDIRGAEVVPFPMTWREEALYAVSQPGVCFILLNLGIAGVYFEFTTPGVIIPGVVGVLALLLAFLGMNILPINHIGLLLILASFVFFFLELQFVTGGLLALAGVIGIAIGGVILIDSPLPALQVPRSTILGVSGSVGLLFMLVLGRLARDLVRPVGTDLESMVDKEGYADGPVAASGTVRISGEIWSAVNGGAGPIGAGDRIRVVAEAGRKLTVVRVDAGNGPEGPAGGLRPPSGEPASSSTGGSPTR
jgi:membrane-bound serine protease (ClpP class)